ncbi:O-antigen polysaccharide polymerase Wzy [Micromonospora sp. RP3T]|uniref:O-antigen polysaccharide polymerase Wzy n=1 Tax=Micromonospora sp. RP3T TaxID=2135446 RepID=UPI000D176B61|nr:O-antigen polysaccharide polymerase Wzy [Micromonospora sp. RP3T]PTA46274.1 hypothetical protein C8054_11190 [Micromonospora sp. RP3T]
MTATVHRTGTDHSGPAARAIVTGTRAGCHPDRVLSIWVAAVGVVLLTLTLRFQDALSVSVQSAAIFTTAVAVGAMVVTARLIVGRRLTLGFVYLLVLVLFHCGQLPYLILRWRPTLYVNGPNGDSLWLTSQMLAPAIITVSIGILAFVTGYAVVTLVGFRPGVVRPPVVTGRTGISTVSLLLLVVGLVLWAEQVAGRGVNTVFTEDYLSMRAYVDMPLLSTGFILIGLGFSALGFSRNDTQRKWALYLFLAFSLVSFTIGFRGESVFAVAAWLVAAARRRTIRVRAWHVLALTAALLAGSVVRQIRLEGVAVANFSAVRLNPADGLAELGSTLQTVVAAREWHASDALPFVGWGTYAAPFERLVLGRALGLPVTPVDHDPRVFMTTIMDRLGPLGGSPVAESYRAAGILGVLVVMALIGVVAGLLDSRPDSSRAGFVTGMFAYTLLVWSRNDFSPVLVQTVGCLVAVGVGLLLDFRAGRVGDRPAAAPGAGDEGSTPPVPTAAGARVRRDGGQAYVRGRWSAGAAEASGTDSPRSRRTRTEPATDRPV